MLVYVYNPWMEDVYHTFHLSLLLQTTLSNIRNLAKHRPSMMGTKGWLDLEGPWPTIGVQIMQLVEKPKTIQVHFTIDLEGMRNQRNLDGNFTWFPIDNVTWYIGFCIKPIKKKWGWSKTEGRGKQFNCNWLLKILFGHGGVLDCLFFLVYIQQICCGSSKWSTFTLF